MIKVAVHPTLFLACLKTTEGGRKERKEGEEERQIAFTKMTPSLLSFSAHHDNACP